MNESGLRKKTVKNVIYTVVVLGLCQSVWAATWTVQPNGARETSLWHALQLAQSGDEIVLTDGVYQGSTAESNIYNKNIALRSTNGPQTCWVDCESNGFLYLYSDDSNNCTIEGVTLMNAEGVNGSAFYLEGMNLTLTNCVIKDCLSSTQGGVLFANQSQVILERCQFLFNTCGNFGGVIASYYGSLTASDCVFAENYSDYLCGVMLSYYTDINFTNCTFHHNTAAELVGILYDQYGQTSVTNCIISDSDQYAFATERSNSSSHISMKHCLLYGNVSPVYIKAYGNAYTEYPSPSQINALSGCSDNFSGEPSFALETNYHLTSESRAIDRGLTSVAGIMDLDSHTRSLDGDADGVIAVDIGAYEYDPNAGCLVSSKTILEFVRDFNDPNPEPQEVEISNCGGAPIDWQALSPVDWLEVDPNANSAQSQSVTVSVNTDDLERGLHNLQLQFVDPNAVNSPLSLLVVLQIRGKLNVPEDFNSIQEAVDAALPGEIVEVQEGTYNETVIIEKPLDLIGVGDPNIQGVIILSDDCNVVGFDCQGGGFRPPDLWFTDQCHGCEYSGCGYRGCRLSKPRLSFDEYQYQW